MTVTATDVNSQASPAPATSNSLTVLPANAAAPQITGTPQQGDPLTVSNGSWNDGATAFSYQWYDCDSSGKSCAAITNEADASTSSYTLQASDVGGMVIAVVTDNVSQIPIASNAVGPVQAAPAPVTTQTTTTSPNSPTPGVGTVSSGGQPQVAPQPAPTSVAGIVTSSMQWTFYYTPSYTVVRSLLLNGASSGATVVIKCQGSGCPFVHRAMVLSKGRRCGRNSRIGCFTAGAFNLTPSFAGRHLAVGAKVTISITRTNWVGKSYRFAVRAGRGPRVQIGCLAPGGGTPGVGC